MERLRREPVLVDETGERMTREVGMTSGTSGSPFLWRSWVLSIRSGFEAHACTDMILSSILKSVILPTSRLIPYYSLFC